MLKMTPSNSQIGENQTKSKLDIYWARSARSAHRDTQ
jgi:hypothetical protein